MDPLSLLSRLAASVPPPRFHTVEYAGVLPPASFWRPRITPRVTTENLGGVPLPDAAERDTQPKGAGKYRPWAELLARTFAVDVLQCPSAMEG
jgi:hypothetical protein